MSGRNILLVGPEGAGKSCLVNDFLDKQGTFYDYFLHIVIEFFLVRDPCSKAGHASFWSRKT